MNDGNQPSYFSYWGKASPEGEACARFHLLAFHSLDVAACGQALLKLPQFSLRPLADELEWPLAQVEALCVFFLALHDLGKFARAFQGLVPDLSPELVPPVANKHYTERHDTLGWLLWQDDLVQEFPSDALPVAGHETWAAWIRSAVGHHGMPPREAAGGGSIELSAEDYFVHADCLAARAFVAEMADWLLSEGVPAPGRETSRILHRHSWRLAGLGVLADWLGSNQSFFPYRAEPQTLPEYWAAHALPQAERALLHAGLHSQPLRDWESPTALFDYLREPTPLQHYAAEVELEDGPQLFLLEDVTGAGKTEAALILTQRLMQAGRANGLYFALPSMATANQMYRRVGQVYQRLYDTDTQPSLILAHGARTLVEGFRQSIVQAEESPADRNYRQDDVSATAQCNAWLADNRKKALLAEVGVGTLDQALLAVLPARHQSLRLLGLAGKVLLVDEVHAYDPYMLTLLKTLLTAHARQGGSVILLSATLPLRVREELLATYRFGLGVSDEQGLDDDRYPLAVRAGRQLISHACATRAQVRRRVEVRALHDEAEVLALIAEQSRGGRCVCWIRNTVEDARRAHQALGELLPAENLMLFHSRYAMGHRLDIEDRVLTCFGKASTAAMRAGQVLVGTQVLEQSLDFDVDLMISDLAPIDLLIQRAGRLQRHTRQANGDLAKDDREQREPPLLYLLTPEAVDEPEGDWYAALFPKACHVYPDAGKLWLGARALLKAGCIVSPGESGQSGAVRELVEAVYGEEVDAVPDKLQKASRDQEGKDLAWKSQGYFNVLKLAKGYCLGSGCWDEDSRVPTRLGDESLTVYLARMVNGELRPLCEGGAHPWEQSAVRINARQIEALAPEWQRQFAAPLQRLRERHRLLEEPAFVLPLLEEAGNLMGRVLDERGRETVMRYDTVSGLCWD
ncbi:CRISPR-associated helicase Cas3' [Stutzerimonas stutzeri]|uniref:CRISPR-associated helicase Cas3' n=1 Tax=Stutzerimonas stutzeri TaxID=316 RepID=UPI0015E289A3|nr:CRISPR-associated helicase Cas3' [Stutzerimonas stutzeri]MBA1262327.1 CRISPR-associated helicase Cas3' [Stutzerimonas stutzeri]